MFRDEHMNLYTIFERAQLFERFGALQRGRFPFHELQQRAAPKPVNALVPQIFNRSRAVAREGDGVAGEVKRIAVKIDNYLYLMRRRGFGGILERMPRRHDVDLAVRPQPLDYLIDQIGIKQRLLSLGFYHKRGLLLFSD